MVVSVWRLVKHRFANYIVCGVVVLCLTYAWCHFKRQ